SGRDQHPDVAAILRREIVTLLSECSWYHRAMLETKSAGGVILNARGEVVLVKNGPDFWGLPKGHIDPGEDKLTAAKREIREETGIKHLSLIEELPSYKRPGGKNLSELKHIHMFLFTTDATELIPEDPSNPEARWVALDK